MKNKIIVMDLDGTICFPNLEFKDSYTRYSMAEPNNDIIKKMQLLYTEGWEFVILTSRRMLTHGGDVKKIKEDVEEITQEWLNRHDVPYSYIQWGKPFAVYYVDDKSMSLEEFVNL